MEEYEVLGWGWWKSSGFGPKSVGVVRNGLCFLNVVISEEIFFIGLLEKFEFWFMSF